MNPLLTEVKLDNEQRQDDILRKASIIDMTEYVKRMEDRKVERRLARMQVMVFIRKRTQLIPPVESSLPGEETCTLEVYHTSSGFSIRKVNNG